MLQQVEADQQAAAQQDEDWEWALYIIFGVFGLFMLLPIVYVYCFGQAIRQCCWRNYNTEAVQERREDRQEKRRSRMAPIYGSVV